MRLIKRFLILALVLYLGGIAYLVSQETRLVFRNGAPLGSARPRLAWQQIDVPRPDGARQFAWVVNHSDAAGVGRPWVLYLHGNRATVGSRFNVLHYEQLHGLGLNVLAPEYRGYSGLDGVPSEAAVASDARAGYDYLRRARHVAPERIVIYGWSLGAAIAVNLAADVPSAAVILEGAPASLVAIGQQQYPIFPIRLLMRNPFDVIDRVNRIRAPMLFLHSPEDQVIPISEGRRLYEAATASKRFVEVRGGHVNASEVDAVPFYAAIGSFLDEHALLPVGVRHGS